jgi:hypothetical protein
MKFYHCNAYKQKQLYLYYKNYFINLVLENSISHYIRDFHTFTMAIIFYNTMYYYYYYYYYYYRRITGIAYMVLWTSFPKTSNK